MYAPEKKRLISATINHFMRFLFVLPVLLVFFLVSCSVKLPPSVGKTGEKIHVGPGTEDMTLDTFFNQKRLLVSCNQRRKDLPHFGEIVAYNLSTKKLDTLSRKEEPKDLVFNPHGIDLVMNTEHELMLYVVNHVPIAGTKEKDNSILLYEVKGRNLVFVKQYRSELIISPNDVAGLPDGGIYVTNDSKHRKMGFTWAMEKLFKMRTSKVVFGNGDGSKWIVATKRLAYANGVHADKNRVIVAATQKKDLVVYNRNADGSLAIQKRLKPGAGLDNISMISDSMLLVPAHPSQGKFIKHARKASEPSPGIVYGVNLASGETVAMYANDGTQISANSVALFYEGKIYIGQVFEDWLQVVDLNYK
jgi:hypothetical protein